MGGRGRTIEVVDHVMSELVRDGGEGRGVAETDQTVLGPAAPAVGLPRRQPGRVGLDRCDPSRRYAVAGVRTPTAVKRRIRYRDVSAHGQHAEQSLGIAPIDPDRLQHLDQLHLVTESPEHVIEAIATVVGSDLEYREVDHRRHSGPLGSPFGNPAWGRGDV